MCSRTAMSHTVSQLTEGPSTLQDRCPACGSIQFIVLGRLAEGFATQVGDQAFWQPPYYARKCTQCSLVFKSAVAPLEQLDEYYQRVDFRKWETLGLFPTEERVLDLLQALPARSRVLDFGCSTGRLLSRLVG